MPNESAALLLLGFVVGFGWLAKQISVPYPIVLVIAGLLVSLVPGLPQISMSPNFIFFAVLPPLLFSAAFSTSWRDFRLNLVRIASLAFGLVGFTVFGIGLLAHLFLPGFDWRTGLVLGAIAAPTDAIAAAAIAQRVGLPRRITDVLEGESLVNDASGLLALEFATALVVNNRLPTFGEGLLRFFLLSAGGIGVGLLVGYIVDFIERKVDDGPIEVTLSFVTPYFTYLAAEHLHCSGVLASVAAGFYLGNRSSYHYSSSVRLQARSFWSTFGFVLNGVVFLLIGLQLPLVLHSIENAGRALWLDAAEFVAAAILLRLIWVFPAGQAAHLIRQWMFQRDDDRPNNRELFVEGWTGMRGAISLAAAIALPETTAEGLPFPQRSIIIILIFSLIFVTLVVQGLSLPVLIRRLGLAGQPGDDEDEERLARCRMLDAALRRIEQMRRKDQRRFRDVYDDVARQYRLRLDSITNVNKEGEPQQDPELLSRYRDLSNQLRTVEREVALRLREQEKISDHVLRTLENELDLLDARFSEE